MHYLGLVYAEEKRWFELPEPQRRRILEECQAYGERFRRSGHLLAGAPLHPVSTATTLRRPDSSKLVITDGPFAETREVLCGYHLFECRNLDEAIEIGAQWPGLKDGLTMEVRPVLSEEGINCGPAAPG